MYNILPNFLHFFRKCSVKNIALPEVVIILSSLFIGVSFLLYYLIDLRNFLGLRDWLFSIDRVYFYFSYTPFFFQHYGRNSGFVELAQWSLLAFGMVSAAYIAGTYASHVKVQKFFIWLSVALVIMLLEDAGDIRHTLMSYVQLAANEPDQGIWGTAFEGVYFSILGGIPLYALLRYGSSLKISKRSWWYMVGGFAAHAIAASLSFIGTAFQGLLDKDLYTLMGETFISISLAVADTEVEALWATWDASNWMFPVGFFLMDSLLEENIELIGNALIVASIIAFWQIQNRKEVKTSE